MNKLYVMNQYNKNSESDLEKPALNHVSSAHIGPLEVLIDA
jgi:hypothetical protein